METKSRRMALVVTLVVVTVIVTLFKSQHPHLQGVDLGMFLIALAAGGLIGLCLIFGLPASAASVPSWGSDKLRVPAEPEPSASEGEQSQAPEPVGSASLQHGEEGSTGADPKLPHWVPGDHPKLDDEREGLSVFD